jgi:hypothetical protein
MERQNSMSLKVQDGVVKVPAQSTVAIDLGWLIRRVLLGVTILFVGIGSLAWLTHASIAPAADVELDSRP